MWTANMRLAISCFAFFLLGTNGNPIQQVEYLRGLYGSFSSPKYPDVYDNNLRKEWIIQVRQGYRIKFKFTAFDLEDSYEQGQGPCVYDYVLVTEGNKTIGRFCGNSDQFPWDAPRTNEWLYTKGNQADIVFVSDYSNEDISPVGFSAHYVETDIDECANMRRKSEYVLEDWDELVVCNHFCNNVPGSYYCSCRSGFKLHSNEHTCVAIANCVDQVLTADQGIIESPDYPNPYAKLSHCSWDIQVRDGLSVHLTFNSEFGVEEHIEEGCVYDILEISFSDRKETYCGTTAPDNGNVMDMNTKHVKLDFKTDLAVEQKGFRIIYNTSRIRCLSLLSNPANGEIATSNPKGYYEFEDVVNHTCNRGYDLIGASSLECLSDGSWNNEQPTCRIKSCGRPDHLISVKYSHIIDLDQKRFEYMESVTVECNDWYGMKLGSHTWRCEDSKKWEKASNPVAPNPPNDIPKCRPKCGMRRVTEDAFEVQLAGAKRVKEDGGWPWMAFVDLGGGRAGKEYCGGTLVDEKTVVTAAHCIQPIDTDENVYVYLGILNRIEDNFNFTQRFDVTWSKRIIEGSYDNVHDSFDGDIAILKLDRPANLSYFVHPICVPNAGKHRALINVYKSERKNAVVTGWGENESGNFSEDLMKTRVRFVEHDTCKRSFSTAFDRNDLITENMICAGFEHGKNDACKGDSGGPLMTKDNRNIWYLNGIVSFGDESRARSCGRSETYGVYTDVSKYNVFMGANKCGLKGAGDNSIFRALLFGGQKSLENEWPWMVFLNFGQKKLSATTGACGGSLISPNYVLTAAHCMNNTDYPDDIRFANRTHVWLGVHYRRADPKTVKYVETERIIVHPKYYKASRWDYDVALIRLRETIIMGKSIRPVCLPSTKEEFQLIKPGKAGKVAGWGLYNTTFRPSDNLMHGEFPIVNHTNCWGSFQSRSLKTNTTLPKDLSLTKNMFCAGDERGSQSTCQGDSGGPFVMTKKGSSVYFELGLVSFGIGKRCGEIISYTGFTKLHKEIVDWIMEKTNNLEFCGKKGSAVRQNPLTRIFSSDEAKKTGKHEYPWAVFLNFGPRAEFEAQSYICGGNLISSRYVLTAAHCLTVHDDPDDIRPPEKTHIWIGAHDRTDDPSTVTYVQAENITLHPNYHDASDWDCDVGLIRLADIVTMNNVIRPICLPSTMDEFNSVLPGANGKVVGWGLFDGVANAANILLEGDFPIVNKTECWNSFSRKSAVLDHRNRLTDNMFCAGYEDDNFSTCQGDSGGAFMMKRDSKIYAAGLVSFALSVECGRAITYTVYARLNKPIVDWIIDETNGLE